MTLYTLSVQLRKRRSLVQRITSRIRKLFNSTPKIDNAMILKELVEGKTFVDIGCLWGVDGKYLFLAEEYGASRSMGIDVYPASEKFLIERKRRNLKAEFLQGDINDITTTDAIGLRDIVLCSGVLYHTPDPIHLLTRLHSICKETLILNTSLIPEMHGIRNSAVFYPFLDEKQRKIWNRGIGSQKSITGPYEPSEGYGNWFWGFTPSCLESMLICVGFRVKERHIEAFNCIFVCEAIPTQLAAVSGEWNAPKDPQFLKFHK